MKSEEILAWTKSHKKELILKILSDANLTPSEHPTAIFMAGLPGAGKTELSRNIIKEGSNAIRIDMDELATIIPSYTPRKADNFRKSATILLNELFSRTIKSQLDFILDGTFGSPMALKNISRVLKRGYIAQVAYIHQDPRLAWQFTLARERIEHRAISQTGFIESYYKTLHNLHALAKLNLPNVSIHIFTKKSDNTIDSQYHVTKDSEIDNLLQVIYNKSELKEYINA